MFYDLGLTLSHNCLFNFIIGGRGIGKSYAMKKHAVKQFLKHGKQFVMLRRYQEEIDIAAPSYFDDIIHDEVFPDVKIEYNAGEYFINEQKAGYAMALTKAKSYKSSSFPMVYIIIFEEFLFEDNGYTRYLKNEVNQFLSFYMSIDRYRGCSVFFLSNAVSMINPYTLYFDLQLPYGSNFCKKDDILLHLVDSADFISNRKETRFGKIVAGTEFAEYAIENKFVSDNPNFIKRKTEKAAYFFTFYYMDEKYGVWIDRIEGEMYVSENVPPPLPVAFPHSSIFTNISHFYIILQFTTYRHKMTKYGKHIKQ